MKRARTLLPGNRGHHAVQFYCDQQRLSHAVSDFLADGLAAGQPTIIIATAGHRDLITRELTNRRFDIESLRREGTLLVLDARETLDSLMVNGRPDPIKFRHFAGQAMDSVCRDGDESVVRAYGEMVDLLWRDSQCAAALQLEVLWNDLAQRYAFSLLCGYSVDGVDRDGWHHEICAQHTHVHGAPAIS